MVGSINTETGYLYRSQQNTLSTSNSALNKIAEKSSTLIQAESSDSQKTQKAGDYTFEEYLEIMRNGKMTTGNLQKLDSTETEEEMEDISNIDADSDGTISTDEYSEMIAQMGISNALSVEEFFNQYDVNADGEISQDEMPEPGSVRGREMAPPPPTIGTAEATKTSDELFSEYDTDGDGVLSSEEFSAMMDALNPEESESSGSTKVTQKEDIDFQKLAYQMMMAYENNYEAMFENGDGTLLNNQA